jgi:hypothetical protein
MDEAMNADKEKTAALTEADQHSVAAALRAEPAWVGMDTASAAFELDSNILLHAGPPLENLDDIPTPIMNSACVAAVYEGLSNDFSKAQRMIASGDIVLKPAQDHAVVTPLAAVVSASMPLHRIDGAGGKGSVYAPINGGSRPSLRLGLRTDAVLNHIRWLNTSFAELLTQLLADHNSKSASPGIALIPLAVKGLAGGDDCHGRTLVANQLMMDALIEPDKRCEIDSDTLNFIETSPSLFLNVWMSASKFIMNSVVGINNSSFVTAVAGNGNKVGIQVAGLPEQWFVAQASAPIGSFDVDVPVSRAVGAIGDSAVVEGLGLGAMAIRHAPEQLKQFKNYLPADINSRIDQLLLGEHAAFKSIGQNIGLCARSVATLGSTPVVALGIIDALGEKGRLGGGIYEMPVAPFIEAVDALNAANV